VGSVDETDANAGIEISHQFTDGLRRRLQEHLQERAVGVKEGPQEVVGGEGDVEVRDIQQVVSDAVDPVVHPDLATRGAEASFAGEWHTKLVLTARTDVESVAAVGVTAEQQTLDDLTDIGALVWRNLIFQAEVTPAVPMIEEDLAEAVVTGGIACTARRRKWVGATPRG
jgi:hypothetical protein